MTKVRNVDGVDFSIQQPGFKTQVKNFIVLLCNTYGHSNVKNNLDYWRDIFSEYWFNNQLTYSDGDWNKLAPFKIIFGIVSRSGYPCFTCNGWIFDQFMIHSRKECDENLDIESLIKRNFEGEDDKQCIACNKTVPLKDFKQPEAK